MITFLPALKLPAFYLVETVLEMLIPAFLDTCAFKGNLSDSGSCSWEEVVSDLCIMARRAATGIPLCPIPSAEHLHALAHAVCTTVPRSRSWLCISLILRHTLLMFEEVRDAITSI